MAARDYHKYIRSAHNSTWSSLRAMIMLLNAVQGIRGDATQEQLEQIMCSMGWIFTGAKDTNESWDAVKIFLEYLSKNFYGGNLDFESLERITFTTSRRFSDRIAYQQPAAQQPETMGKLLSFPTVSNQQ